MKSRVSHNPKLQPSQMVSHIFENWQQDLQVNLHCMSLCMSHSKRDRRGNLKRARGISFDVNIFALGWVHALLRLQLQACASKSDMQDK